MKLYQKIFLTLGSWLLALGSINAQVNLVSNGYFEIYSQCPNDASSYPSNMQINYATGWHAAGLTPDYFNACASPSVGVSEPRNFAGYQPDCCGGGGYVGAYMFDKYASNNDREYIYTKLIDTLKAGHKYLASIYVNKTNVFNYAVASIGMLFTDTATALPWPQGFIQANPQVKNTTLLADTANWTLIQDTITAVGNETYLTIGNFNTDVTSDTAKLENNNSLDDAYYFIDGVSVYDITTNICNNLWGAGFNASIFAGDSVHLGAINTDNSTFTWVNSVGGNTYLSSNIDARPWAKPSVTTTYYVTKTCPTNNVFIDTVTVFVQQRVGIKQFTNIANVSVYPNPANNILNITSSLQFSSCSLQLYNVLGAVVKTQTLKNTNEAIDVSLIANGVYFVVVTNNQQVLSTQKIVVQH